MECSKSDWKLFRTKIAEWQENYMNRLNKEYIELFCDEIVVFENGEIVQRGAHEQLVEQKGLYQELWNAQAQYYA